MLKQVLVRYLDRYAEPVAQTLASNLPLLTNSYQFVLCVPAYDEAPNFIAPLLETIQDSVLAIIVFNTPEDREPSDAQQQTQSALRSLTEQPQQLSLVSWNKQVDILAVDCCTPGRKLPLKEGVGLARKIAGDLAIVAIAFNKIASPWIYCTDADVTLPPDYFEAIPRKLNGCAAALYPFTHMPAHDNILQYEISLRYYVLQLERLKSPYAFQTVGSSMAVHAQSYVAVRGFPKRNAAEDFYILNKLTKIGEMTRLKTTPLTLSSRRSHRVPFGTGAAMNKLAVDPAQLLYHPEIFAALGQWFRQMDRLWDDRDQVQHLGFESWWQQHPVACSQVLPILIEQGLPKVLRQAFRQCRDRPHFLYYLHVWFDAFRTLRFIHLMRDRGWPSIQISELSKLEPALNLSESSLSGINQQLTLQEQALPARIGPTQFIRR